MSDPLTDRARPRPRYLAQIAECRGLASDFVDARFPELFEQAGAALIEFAARAESNTVQSRFFEAMEQLRRRRSDLERVFHRELDAGFQNFGKPRPDTQDAGAESGPAEGSELSLMDPDDMEESVAAENLISRANANYFPELYALSQRLSVVAGGRKLKDSEIPAGPYHLVHSFRRALEGLDVEVKVKVILYALFDKVVIRQCRRIYDGFNEVLKGAGILPKLKPVHLRSDAAESKGPAMPEQGSPDSAEPQPGPVTSGEPEGGEPGDLGTELFYSILDLMATRRPAKLRLAGRPDQLGLGRGERPTPTPERAAAATGKLISALNQAQARRAVAPRGPAGLITGAGAAWPAPPAQAGPGTQPATSAADASAPADGYPNVEMDNAFLDRVRIALAQERQQILGQTDREDLSPVDADLIDLIGMLFEYMLNDPVLPDAAKALLSHLHTPYLKLALIDRSLLEDTRHPARSLFDSMVEAGSLWVEDNNPTRGIFPVMQQTVDRVLKEFTNDVGLFDELVQSFKQAMGEQQRRADTTEQRTQEAARGREKLQLSKQRASRQAQALTTRHPMPQALSNFLGTTWLDHMVFILLRDEAGEESGAWREAVTTAEALVALFAPAAMPAERRSRIDGIPQLRASVLRQVERMGGYSHTSVDALTALLDNAASWKADDLPSPADASAKARRAAAAQAVVTIGLPQDDTGPEARLSGPQKEMAERLRKIRFGTWFAFNPEHGGAPRRIKLSWISPLTSTCMFVDRSGMQAEIKTLGELAEEVLSGRAKVIPRPLHPFIDRALLSIRKMLQRDPGDGVKPVAG
jgi:hypothetical protein